MVSIKHFKDGDRLVVVFDGIDITEEGMAMSYLKNLGSVATEDASVQPVNAPSEENPVKRVAFMDGPYKGKTPEEAYAEAERKTPVFKYLVKAFNVFNDTDLNKEIQDVIRAHLKKFTTPAAEYAASLTKAQLEQFITLYAPLFPESLQEEIYGNEECGMPIDEESLRLSVEKIVLHFNRL